MVCKTVIVSSNLTIDFMNKYLVVIKNRATGLFYRDIEVDATDEDQAIEAAKDWIMEQYQGTVLRSNLVKDQVLTQK